MPKIMIADGDFAIGMEIEEMLTALGHDVVGQAGSGQEAVKMARDCKPDIIIMDIVMSGEMNGIEAAEKIKAEFDIPIIFISGYGDSGHIEEAKLIEPFGYVMKPFDEKEIRAFVEIALHKKKMELKLRKANDQLEQANHELKQEIKGRKETEKALRESKKNLGAVLGASPVGIGLVVNRKLDWANETMYRMVGYEQDSLLGQSARILYPDDKEFERASRGELYTGLKETGTGQVETRWIRKDGTIFDCILRVCSLDPSHPAKGQIAAVTDISELKLAHEELRKSEERYKALFEHSLDCVYIHDLEGNFLDANPAALELFGYDKEEISSLNIASVLSEDQMPAALQVLEEVKEKGYQKNITEFRIKSGEGRNIHVETQSAMIYHGTTPYAVQGIARDITERKHAEEQIMASLKEKGILLQEIDQLVKNNMQIMSSLFELCIKRAGNQETIGFLEDMRARIHAMALVHNQLYQSDQFVQIDMGRHIHELVGYLSQIYASGKKIVPVVDATDIYLSITQATPIGFVLNELVGNAYKHAFKGREEGTIEVSIKRSAEDMFRIKVRDDGVGIPQEIAFEKVDSLGLMLARTTIRDQMQGSMEIKRDKGTEIIMEIKIFPYARDYII